MQGRSHLSSQLTLRMASKILLPALWKAVVCISAYNILIDAVKL